MPPLRTTGGNQVKGGKNVLGKIRALSDVLTGLAEYAPKTACVAVGTSIGRRSEVCQKVLHKRPAKHLVLLEGLITEEEGLKT